MPAEERTEPATPKRREEARKKGQTAKSLELSSAFILIIGFSLLWLLGPYMFNALKFFMRDSFNHIGTFHFSDSNIIALSIKIIFFCLRMIAPLVISILFVGILINILQTGFIVSFYPLRPDFSKINPITGFSRILSLHAFVELIKSLIKVVIVGWLSYSIIRNSINVFLSMVDSEVALSMSILGSTIIGLALKIGLALIILAILDFAYQKLEYEKSLRMTKQEVKEELKQREGDPLIKAKIRQRMRQIALRRMMKEVPKADVVITNPIFIAVALQYDAKTMPAPLLLAKGAGVVAERIKNKKAGASH